MRNILILVFAIVPFFTQAKKTKKHEVGIGIGFLQYDKNIARNNNQSIYKNSLFFNSKSINKIGIGYFDAQNNYLIKQTPVFYYSFQLHKNIRLRTAYQYSITKSNSIPWNYFVGGDDYWFGNYSIYENHYSQNKINDMMFGIEYSFINNKRFAIYTGLDFNLILSKQYISANGHYSDNTLFNYGQYYKQNSYTLNFPIGIKINLSNSINLKYEASFYFPDAFRPINRLSINYQF